MSEPLSAAGALTDAAPAEPVATAPVTEPATAPVEPAPAAEPTEPDAPALKMPGKDATPEDWQAFYKQVGVPDDPSGYEVKLLEGEPEDLAATVQKMFKDANLLPQQAEKLLAARAELAAAEKAHAEKVESDRLAALDAKNKAEDVSLRNEWGQNHEQNVELAKRAVRQFIPADKAGDVLTSLENSIGYAETMRLMHNIGRGLGEHDAAGLRPAEATKKSAAEILYGGTK